MEIKEKGQQIYISFTLVYIDELITKLKKKILFFIIKTNFYLS